MFYHIIPPIQWKSQANLRHYQPESLRTDGFIHLSYDKQVNPVLNRLFSQYKHLLVLYVFPGLLEGEIRLEDSYQEGIEYPHLYAPLNTTAIIFIQQLSSDSDGNFSWYPVTLSNF